LLDLALPAFQELPAEGFRLLHAMASHSKNCVSEVGTQVGRRSFGYFLPPIDQQQSVTSFRLI
jgi:hypothetical protein